MAYAIIAMSRQSYFDLGQIVAICAFFLSFGSILGGSCNFIASTEPTERERMHARELRFEAAVFTVAGTAVQSLLGSALLAAVAAVAFTLQYQGIGDILRHFLNYTWMQYTQWYDRQTLKPVGRWDAWVLHARDLQLLHDFHVTLGGRRQEDGAVTIQFHATEDPYNMVATRSVPVRALSQQNMSPFDGDNIKLNIGSWRSIIVVNVMYQHQNGAQPQKVASGLWDPWSRLLLTKCFDNAKICDPGPLSGTKMKSWDFQDLVDIEGKPRQGHYVEGRIFLSPGEASLSLNLTHLGPKAVLEERDDPSDQPSKELFLGDTTVGDGGFMRISKRHHQAALPPSPTHTAIGAVSFISGYATPEKLGIGGIELTMRHPDAAPRRYGEDSGRQHAPFALGPDEWIVAVHQQVQDKNPKHFGACLNFITSAGKVHSLPSKGGTPLHFVAASIGFQIRELKYEGAQLQELTVSRADKKGLQEIVWAANNDIEYVEFVFRDGRKEANGRKPHHHDSEIKMERRAMELSEYLIAVAQEKGDSRNLGNALMFFTSKGNVIRAAGKHAEKDFGGRVAAREGRQITGLTMHGFLLAGVDTAPARQWD